MRRTWHGSRKYLIRFLLRRILTDTPARLSIIPNQPAPHSIARFKVGEAMTSQEIRIPATVASTSDDETQHPISHRTLGESNPKDDPLFGEALRIVAKNRDASVSYLQRRLKIGFNRAAWLLEAIGCHGVVDSVPDDSTRQWTDEQKTGKTLIKVMGIGGAGGNAIEYMIGEGLQDIDFILADTDTGSLYRSSAGTNLPLGSGISTEDKPEIMRDLTMACERIAETIEGAHILFLIAGMGGGTGTSAAPIIAKVAREQGILTVALAIKPAGHEGKKRISHAEKGLLELGQNVDSLVVIHNENLLNTLGDIPPREAYSVANSLLKNVVGDIYHLINQPGLIEIDFEDLRSVLGNGSKVMVGSAIARGENRTIIATKNAMTFPLME